MNKVILFLVLIWRSVGSVYSQSTASEITPHIKSKEEARIVSSVILPVSVLENQINHQFKDLVYEAKNIPADGYGTFDCKVWKMEAIRLKGIDNSQDLEVNAPLKIWIKGDIKTSFMGMDVSYPLNENLLLKVNLQISIKLKENWQIETKTQLKDYQWIEKPSIKLGFIKIPLTSIADEIIEKQKTDLCKQFDTQIAQSVSLRESIGDAWRNFQNPQVISEWEKEKTWLQFIPQSLGLSNLIIEQQNIKTQLSLLAQTKATIGEPLTLSEYKSLPNYVNTKTAEARFEIPVIGRISKDLAVKKSKVLFGQETYKFNGKEAKIQDIDMYSESENLVIALQLVGDIEGKVLISGKPTWDYKRQELFIQDLTYQLDKDSKKAVSGFVRWLFNGKIKKKLKEAIEEPLNTQIKSMRQELEKTLTNYDIAPQVNLQGKLNEFAFVKIWIEQGYIFAKISLKGNFQTFIKGF
jgi:Domain of unknown function (DUF4403)